MSKYGHLTSDTTTTPRPTVTQITITDTARNKYTRTTTNRSKSLDVMHSPKELKILVRDCRGTLYYRESEDTYYLLTPDSLVLVIKHAPNTLTIITQRHRHNINFNQCTKYEQLKTPPWKLSNTLSTNE